MKAEKCFSFWEAACLIRPHPVSDACLSVFVVFRKWIATKGKTTLLWMSMREPSVFWPVEWVLSSLSLIHIFLSHTHIDVFLLQTHTHIFHSHTHTHTSFSHRHTLHIFLSHTHLSFTYTSFYHIHMHFFFSYRHTVHIQTCVFSHLIFSANSNQLALK